MTWDAHNHRGQVLRAVIDEANSRRDGLLPLELPDVADTFGDELALVGALQLRWHTRLAGHIESALAEQPQDLDSAVLAAWRSAAGELPGVRKILDACSDAPTSEAMRKALTIANRKDWALLAAMAGRASAQDDVAARVGQQIELTARAAYNPVLVPDHHLDHESDHQPGPSATTTSTDSLLKRIKAHLAA